MVRWWNRTIKITVLDVTATGYKVSWDANLCVYRQTSPGVSGGGRGRRKQELQEKKTVVLGQIYNTRRNGGGGARAPEGCITAEESHRKNNNIAFALCAGQNNNNKKPKKRCPPCIRLIYIYISYIIRYFSAKTAMGQHTLSSCLGGTSPLYIPYIYIILLLLHNIII